MCGRFTEQQKVKIILQNITNQLQCNNNIDNNIFLLLVNPKRSPNNRAFAIGFKFPNLL